MKLHLGCGRAILPGWINLDKTSVEGVDLVVDLEGCVAGTIPLAASSVDELLANHMLEHIASPLPLMQELHRIARPDALFTVTVPYGSSDDAWEDPTHRRPYFCGSWGYFGQPYYYRADYGYTGDWELEQLSLTLRDNALRASSLLEIAEAVSTRRNLVSEMTAVLRAIKPIRPPAQTLIRPPFIRYLFPVEEAAHPKMI